jgi:predicted Zn-dependent peptidase
MAGMTELLQQMPLSENTFEISRASLDQQIRNDRITKEEILRTYHSNLKLGIKGDSRQFVFNALPKLSMRDVSEFQKQFIAPLKYTTIVLGNEERLDKKALEKYGPVSTLELKDIFGY